MKQQLDEQVATMIFATNSPFRLTEHAEFKKMVELLHPGYTPPTRKDIADKHLPKVYEKYRSQCQEHLGMKTVCMGLDGWSNIHNEPIICVTATTAEGEVHLLETVDTSGHPHTAEYLTELATESIQKAEAEFNCTVGSVVTDNAANVAKMRRELAELQKEKKLLTYGCAAHQLNLLAHDLEIAGVKNHVVHILRYFRNNHLAGAALKQESGHSLVLPQETRWNTMADSLQSYLQAWPALMKIVEELRDKIDHSIRRKVIDLSLKRSAEDLLARLSPIATALDQVQADSCNIGRAVNAWKQMDKKLSADKEALGRSKDRYKKAMTPAHYLANIIDPRLKGEILSEDERNEALRFARDHYDSDFLPTVMKYLGRAPPFDDFKFQEQVVGSMSPVVWWRSHTGAISEDSMAAASQLLSSVASSAAVERVFSSLV